MRVANASCGEKRPTKLALVCAASSSALLGPICSETKKAAMVSVAFVKIAFLGFISYFHLDAGMQSQIIPLDLSRC